MGPGPPDPVYRGRVNDTRDPAALVAALRDDPKDGRLRRAAADALAEAGRWAEAVRILDEELVNVAAHDDGSKGCLCARCLPREGGPRPLLEQAGLRLRLEFSVTGRRVLYYWMPETLVGARRRVDRSVAAEMSQRLREPRS